MNHLPLHNDPSSLHQQATTCMHHANNHFVSVDSADQLLIVKCRYCPCTTRWTKA